MAQLLISNHTTVETIFLILAQCPTILVTVPCCLDFGPHPETSSFA